MFARCRTGVGPEPYDGLEVRLTPYDGLEVRLTMGDPQHCFSWLEPVQSSTQDDSTYESAQSSHDEMSTPEATVFVTTLDER